MLRVRDEARWIREVIESIKPLTTSILLFDDHSTDETPLLAAMAGAWVIPSPFEDTTDETRDKNYLLSIVRSEKPDYVLAIDGDEVLAPGAAEKIRPMLSPHRSIYSLPIKFLWNDRSHYRCDGVYETYAKSGRASLFTLIGQSNEIRFAQYSSAAKCNFHCGNVPRGLRGVGCWINAPLLHLGYMLQEDRIRKYKWYNDKDPANHYEDQYRHMVIGDILPADTVTRWAGPLKVYRLPESEIAQPLTGTAEKGLHASQE
jgi:glycosyltransferase involved in cell wall biosynthesis